MVWIKELEKIRSDLEQKEMLERPNKMEAQIQLTQGEAINFCTQAQQVKLETMLEGEAKHLGAGCHQVTRVLKRDLVSKQELTGLE